MMDWWKDFWLTDAGATSRGEHGSRRQRQMYYLRPDGRWTRDERRDDDLRHRFTMGQVCDRCGQGEKALVDEHLAICPLPHVGPASCRLVLMCEVERRVEQH